MKMWMVGILGTGLMACLGGCGGSSKPEPEGGPEGAAAGVAEAAAAEITAEFGCGGCIYKMEGVEECKTAIKLDGKTYLVEGGGLNAHKAGLCEAARQGQATGRLDGNVFKASKITLL